MRIGLIDVDGHKYPNLALMKISAYWKNHDQSVEWYDPEASQYDVVYMSKVFSDEYTKDYPEPINADLVVRGGQDMLSSWKTEERCITKKRM